MKLYTAGATPFGRKVSIVALEHDIQLDPQMINVYETSFLDTINPLRQIPTLVLDDGAVLYDSDVICEYLDSIAKKPNLFPDKDRWAWRTRCSLAKGLTEASVAFQGQKTLPENERSKTLYDRHWGRINRAIDALEKEAGALASGALRIDQIAVGCGLGHVEFRHTKDWRGHCPKLAAWYEGFAKRPSMLTTAPKA